LDLLNDDDDDEEKEGGLVVKSNQSALKKEKPFRMKRITKNEILFGRLL
jgi:hypothetical protein